MKKTAEGKASFYADTDKKVSRSMEVFYNPIMAFNRDVTIRLLNSSFREGRKLRIGLPLAGTGVRGLRILLETDAAESIHMNDLDQNAYKTMLRNAKHNSILDKVHVTNKDANDFILSSTGFDYIDIDPFGSPNPFLDSAIKRISRGGILAVTATDTAPLCGTYPSVCRRKYWAEPARTPHMHEVGLRILIRKIQLIGMQYEKALTPIISYYRNHYFRIFFTCKKGKKECDRIYPLFGSYLYCRTCGVHQPSPAKMKTCCKKSIISGPLYLGSINDPRLAAEISGEDRFLQTLSEESQIDLPFFHDIHVLCKIHKIARLPKTEDILDAIKQEGVAASRTHFSPKGIRTAATDMLKIITRLNLRM